MLFVCDKIARSSLLTQQAVASRGLAVLLFLMMTSVTQADAIDGVFTISEANSITVEDVLFLNANISYSLSPGAIEALSNGVPLTFETQIELERVRRYWPDSNIVQLVQRSELSYHALTERFVVKNLNSSEQLSFGTLSEALVKLGQYEDVPVIDIALLYPSNIYTIRMRSVLDTRSYAAPLRLLAALFRVDDWRLESPWYKWQVYL